MHRKTQVDSNIILFFRQIKRYLTQNELFRVLICLVLTRGACNSVELSSRTLTQLISICFQPTYAASTSADLKQLKRGALTKPLQSIYCSINGVGQEECVLDGGSMIVSMNKKVAVQLGLLVVWDPTIRINMESASNHVEQTLGVACNVTFNMGGLRLFLQVHILENPPYRVLLGRPFETLAATVVQTYEDGSSEVVVKCPNTKRVAVVPTYERGKTPEDLQKTKFQDF